MYRQAGRCVEIEVVGFNYYMIILIFIILHSIFHV